MMLCALMGVLRPTIQEKLNEVNVKCVCVTAVYRKLPFQGSFV
jgi:hypothetical protein